MRISVLASALGFCVAIACSGKPKPIPECGTKLPLSSDAGPKLSPLTEQDCHALFDHLIEVKQNALVDQSKEALSQGDIDSLRKGLDRNIERCTQSNSRSQVECAMAAQNESDIQRCIDSPNDS